MKTFTLKISSPEGDLFYGEAVKLSLRASEGDLAVMAGHIPFISSVKPCDCKIELEDGSERVGTTDGGLLNVGLDKVMLLSGSFRWKE
ncbi:MAG: F0F1 ATP synthase subunit epsilon [Clostridia bacterium]|nr:F0F1 ATP synthase subunit epsilon [Clostridia bacterium]